MPIYEFTCLKCGAPAEVLQRVGSRPPPCPGCGSKRMTRAVSRTSFQLKGGGWYADLYATPRPGGSRAEGADAAKAAEGSKQAKGTKEKAAPGSESSGAPATPPASPPAPGPPGPGAAAKEATRPPPGRSASPRKRR